MNPDQELLKRNLLFFHSKQKKDLANDHIRLEYSQKIIDVIEDMIDRGKVKDFMGMEAIYFYCLENMTEESKLNDHACEIVEFLC